MADERKRQTSNKAGVKSLAEKMDNSRHGFDEHPGSKKTAGAFGEEEPHEVARESSTGTTRKSKQVPLDNMRKNE